MKEGNNKNGKTKRFYYSKNNNYNNVKTMRKLISQNLTLSNPLKVCNLRRFVHNYILLKEKFLQKYIIWNKFPYIYPEFAVYISVIF